MYQEDHRRMPSFTKTVTLLSQVEAERMNPAPGSTIISITDPDKPFACLPQWNSVYRESFYDGGYSESTIKMMKGAFRLNYAGYICSEKSRKLANYLDNLVTEGRDKIFVHCYFGKSRSGAVAKYLQDKHCYIPNKEIYKPNITVYELLTDPNKYEPLIQSLEKEDISAKRTLIKDIWYWLMIAIGIKR